ncbi:hypothetical protein GCM10010274_54880 [Streptomyces lavendofoliae]|uniref:ATP-dependent DNA helicase RecQ zinc-binding domain-containing protein n=1 Tax=Streptomyces lavendofoliae TaxID=67314 RepID=A0A918I431_9ACTN|nr:hypothetical protein GCM10010274_54880 [Streptomyces lavendofoliae]
MSADEAVEQAGEAARARKRLERTRVEMVRAYAETTGCRRRFLLGYFGEPYEAPCGSCDVCEAAAGDAPVADGTPLAGRADAKSPRSADVAGGAGGAGDGRAPDTAGSPFGAGARVRHREWGDGSVLSEEGDRVTVLFDTMGYRTLSLPAVAGGDLLSVLERPGG